MKNSTPGALMTLACAVLVGCSSTPVAPAAASTPGAATVSALPSTSGSCKPVTSSTAPSVHFDFDDFSVKNEYRGLIERHAKYLVSMPHLAIKVEGNADERGSAEYSPALGQRRAEAVRKALEIYGVKDSQLEAVNWVSEHSRVQGHDEAA